MDEVRKTKRRGGMKARILQRTAVLPAAFTLLNGLAGFAAIHFATKDGLNTPLTPESLSHLQFAAWLLFGAMVCDMLDGRVARMTRTTSDFGAQLDSICDMLSFGAAPAIIALRASVSIFRQQDFQNLPLERVVWCMAAVYVACTALRLARFNVETEADESAHMDFRGLPSPGAAACVAALVLLFTNLIDANLSWLPQWILLRAMSVTLPLLTLAAGLLMVSRFKYPHLVNHYIRGRKPFSYLVKLVFLIVFMLIWPHATLAVGCIGYALSGPASAGWLIMRRRRAKGGK